MESVIESSNSVFEWLKSEEAIKAITEAQEMSDELVNNLREEIFVDINNLNKPCNL
jgi:hypothetical protein